MMAASPMSKRKCSDLVNHAKLSAKDEVWNEIIIQPIACVSPFLSSSRRATPSAKSRYAGQTSDGGSHGAKVKSKVGDGSAIAET